MVIGAVYFPMPKATNQLPEMKLMLAVAKGNKRATRWHTLDAWLMGAVCWVEQFLLPVATNQLPEWNKDAGCY